METPGLKPDDPRPPEKRPEPGLRWLLAWVNLPWLLLLLLWWLYGG